MSSGATPPPGVLPLGQSTIPGGIDLTLGQPSVAQVLSAFLTGILTVQTYTYYTRFPKDSVWLKVFVAYIYVLDFLQMALIIALSWFWTVKNWGNLAAAAVVPNFMGLAVFFGVVVIFSVQMMFLYRIVRLFETPIKSLPVVLPIFVLIALETAMGIRLAATGLTQVAAAELAAVEAKDKWISATWLSCGVVADVLLSAVLVRHLWTRKTGFKDTDNFITRLVTYSINTCGLTSAVAIVDMICFFVMMDNFVHLTANLMLCKLFSNSLMSSLNMRRSGRTTFTPQASSATHSGAEPSNFIRITREHHTDGHLHPIAMNKPRANNSDDMYPLAPVSPRLKPDSYAI